jgi:protein HIRA/HIR1
MVWIYATCLADDPWTIDMVVRLDLHAGFVKGIVWDPVGQYLASQSDDKSVKIWRTTDWRLERDITEPFAGAPNSSFFMRLSWSPDGSHLVTPNSMNGPVFVSSVLERFSFNSQVSLVGHDCVVEVVVRKGRGSFLICASTLTAVDVSSRLSIH